MKNGFGFSGRRTKKSGKRIKKSGKRTKIILSLLLLGILSSPSYAFRSRNLSMINEIYRLVYAVTGEKLSDSIEYPENFPNALAYMYARVSWSEDGSPCRVLDKLFPDFSGMFDGAGLYNTSLDDGLWLKEDGLFGEDAFKVYRPKKLDDALSEIEKINEGEISGGSDEASIENDSETSRETPELPSLQVLDKEDEVLSSGKLSQTKDDSPEKRLRNSERFLRLHSFESEMLSLQISENERTVVLSDGKKMFRKFYDSNLRLTKKEQWKPSTSLNDIKILNTEEYFYKDDSSLIPSAKVLVSQTDENRFAFDEKGRVTSLSYYSYPENYSKQAQSEEEKKPFLILWATSYVYTESGKLSEKKYTVYDYSSEKYGVVLDTDVKLEKWFFKVEGGEPDYEYYENGKLCMKTEYSSPSDWITTMYFDNGFTVENHWKGGIHEKDLYFFNGSLLRRQDRNVKGGK